MKIIHNNKERQTITYGCLALLILTIVAYMYFLSMSVVEVVVRKDTLQDITRLRSDIAFLESSYIKANYEISQKVALTGEFAAVKDKTFIKKSADQGLVLRTAGE